MKIVLGLNIFPFSIQDSPITTEHPTNLKDEKHDPVSQQTYGAIMIVSSFGTQNVQNGHEPDLGITTNVLPYSNCDSKQPQNVDRKAAVIRKRRI